MRNVYKIFLFTFLLLTINFQVFAKTSDNSLKTTVSDSVITARVKSQFVANDHTKATSINVETNAGVVKLTGIVDSELEAATAIQIAQSMPSVKEVDTKNLHVKENPQKSKRLINDIYITAKVKGILIRNQLINKEGLTGKNIIVETQNSNVYLSGQLENQDQLNNAIELAKSISGVKKVISKITVSEIK